MKRMDIVVFTTRDWSEYQRRPHYTALANYARVLAVELPVTPFSMLRDSGKASRWARGEKGLRRESPSLYVYTPLSLMPYGLSYRRDGLSALNSRTLAWDVRRILKRLDFKNWVQIFFLPYQDGLQRILDPVLRCFEIVDEYTTLHAPDSDPNTRHDRRVAMLEARIARQVDLVLATSRTLYDRKRALNPHTYYVPNAADVDHFAKARGPNGAHFLPGLTELPSPRIGFIGHMTDFLDVDLLRGLARARPAWSLVLVGEDNTTAGFRADCDFAGFLRMPNVHWLGRRDYEVLPDYLRELDACVMPYQPRDRMQYSHPNKMYQYLASGKPVVSTDFPAARELDHVIEVAPDRDAFFERLDHVLSRDTAAAGARRVAVAEANSLDVRARQKIGILTRHLENKGSGGL